MERSRDFVVPSVDEAVAASKVCAAAAGLDVRSAEVIAIGYSVRVLLQPAQVVSRVITEGQVLRGDPIPWLRREVEVASFLATSGAAVVPPAKAPGPYRAGGLDVTFWQWLEPQSVRISQRQFAALLFNLHQHLDNYDGELPVLVGPLTDVEAALRLSDDEVLHHAAARLLPEARDWPRRPLHGDAHTDNLLSTREGHLWLDFEDACLGPLEWDFASRTVTDDAIAAYPGDLDPHLLQRCRQLRRLQILAALLTSDIDPEAESLRHELRNALSAEIS
jgi:hypothetical protein